MTSELARKMAERSWREQTVWPQDSRSARLVMTPEVAAKVAEDHYADELAEKQMQYDDLAHRVMRAGLPSTERTLIDLENACDAVGVPVDFNLLMRHMIGQRKMQASADNRSIERLQAKVAHYAELVAAVTTVINLCNVWSIGNEGHVVLLADSIRRVLRPLEADQ